MASAARYITLSDGPFILNFLIPEKLFKLKLPSGFSVDRTPAVLFFKLNASELDDFELRVWIGHSGIQVLEKTLNGDYYQTIHELIGDPGLVGNDNDLTFQYLGGDGTLKISDVFILLQGEV
jgi:hypothetical protein